MLKQQKIKWFWLCWLLILPILFLGLSNGKSEAATKRYTVLGGQVGGSWNPWASAMAVLFSKNMPGYSFSSGAGTGSPENIRRMNRGEVETGFAFSSDMYESWQGGGIFKTPHQNVRAVSNLFNTVGHVITHAGSDIKKIEDIVGKDIAMGGPNSGAALTGETFTKHLGLWGKFKPILLGGGKAVDALGDHQVAAFNWHVNIGHSSIAQAAATFKIRLIDLGSPAEKSGFYKAYPYFSPTVIPAGAYKWIDAPVPTFKQSTVWTANKDLDPEVVYQMLKQMYAPENKEFLTQSIGKVFLEMTKENAFAGITIPLHPGAERFWKEQGVAIPPEIAAK